MVAETPETNENSTPETQKSASSTSKRTRRTNTSSTAATETATEKETMALSVKDKSESTSHLVYRPDVPGNRPIEASHLKVVSTYSSVGATRPVVASGMEIKGTLTISGQRPIMASHLQVSDTYTVMGNRPVASNEIDDVAILMGFLD